MTTSITPRFDRVIIQKIEAMKKTATGLYIPGSATNVDDRGRIVAIGEGKLLEDGTYRPVSLSLGDLVVFQAHTGQHVKVGGDEFIILREQDVIAVIEE